MPLGTFDNAAPIFQVVAMTLGSSIEWVEVSDEVLASKDMRKMNPAGMFPMIEVSGSGICGISAICKHLAR